MLEITRLAALNEGKFPVTASPNKAPTIKAGIVSQPKAIDNVVGMIGVINEIAGISFSCKSSPICSAQALLLVLLVRILNVNITATNSS